MTIYLEDGERSERLRSTEKVKGANTILTSGFSISETGKKRHGEDNLGSLTELGVIVLNAHYYSV